MSRKARHARHAEKRTPRGSSSVSGANAARSKPKVERTVVWLAIALIMLLTIAGCGIFEFVTIGLQVEKVRAMSEAEALGAPSEPSVEITENPIDFASERKKAPDIHAWIYVPNTNVNLPIMRHPTEDDYYLNHMSDKEASPIGALFTQSMNSLRFTDPVTVVYGHDLPGYGVMFTELHKFEDPSFFTANDEFFVYLPGHVLTYEVVAAYEYDDRHIMNSFDFTDEAVLQGYFDSVLAPESDDANVREGASLDAAHDRIVQLSTCTTASDPSKRYLVTGVLTSDRLAR